MKRWLFFSINNNGTNKDAKCRELQAQLLSRSCHVVHLLFERSFILVLVYAVFSYLGGSMIAHTPKKVNSLRGKFSASNANAIFEGAVKVLLTNPITRRPSLPKVSYAF
jgi:hypothetical protein